MASGQMQAIHGKKGSYDYHYVQRLEYDQFEQRQFLQFGNNTITHYAYDPYNRRLANLRAGKGDGNLFMDLSYQYDDVGNITEMGNAATTNSPSQMGGATAYSYQYDDLYRLTDSTGTFDTAVGGSGPDKQHAYTLNMQYNNIHNITQKTQLHTLKQPSGKKINQKKTSYDWTYKYDGPQPHAPTHLGERTFSYDANGNQKGWTHDKNGTRRAITWDEENRIQQIQDNGQKLTYTYDASGQRLTKRGPQGETGYINQWFTLRNGEVGTKHIFAGTTRVVSKLVKQDKPNTKRNSEAKGGKARIVYEKDQYYFHPDHLGTSSYITHTNGQVYQHLEYFPFGETWVEEHSNKQRTPYLFTGKELDEETGLYYFGARYYDPRTSVWASVDPILEKYLGNNPSDLSGVGGVFNSTNLPLYGYSHNNPANIFDPDGKEILYANHQVALNMYHSKLVIVPENQAAWRDHPKALRNPKTNSVFFTLGGGPDTDSGIKGPLMGGINRAKDVSKNLSGSDSDTISLSVPSRYSNEDEAIGALMGAVDNYNDKKAKPGYALFPRGEDRNSNGFISGLLNATGFDVPKKGDAIRPPQGGVKGARGPRCNSSCMDFKRSSQNSEGKTTRALPGFGLPVQSEMYQ